MILRHPLNKENGANKKAIEKYKDRQVKIRHGKYNMWMGNSCWVSDLQPKAIMTFKEALKLTKNFNPESIIEYHFLDEIGQEKPNIKDFEQDEVYNCPTIKFD